MCDKWIPETLIFGAGGHRHLLTLGFLVELEDNKLLEKINNICACSTGAIIAILLACGYQVREIITFFVEMEFIKSITNFDIRTLISSVSLEYDDRLADNLNSLVMEKFGYIPTLNELYLATGISLEIITLDYKNKIPKVLNKETEKDLSCVDSVLFTCNLPGMYHKHLYKGLELVEGSLASPYPISFTNQSKNILGFFLVENQTDPRPNFVTYFNDVVSLLMLNCYRKEMFYSPGHQTIYFLNDPINSAEEKAKAILKGTDEAKKWLENV